MYSGNKMKIVPNYNPGLVLKKDPREIETKYTERQKDCRSEFLFLSLLQLLSLFMCVCVLLFLLLLLLYLYL